MTTIARVTIAVLLCLAVVAGSGCRTPDASEDAQPQGDSQAATVEALDFRFSPRTVELEPGKELTLTVHNTGRASHTFTTDDAPVDVVVKPGERREVTFTPPGRVAFFCRFHQSEGMKGVLCPRAEECTPPLFP